MSRCKDCIHEIVCDALIKTGLPWNDGEYPAEAFCMAFKNKADVVEVVRCKDCVHWGGVAYGFICRKFSGIETKICMGADHYCSYGERKDENEG